MIMMEVNGLTEQYRTRIISTKLNINIIIQMFDQLQVKHWDKIRNKLEAIKSYYCKWNKPTCNKAELRDVLDNLEGCLNDLIELRAYYKRLCRKDYSNKWIIYHKDNVVTVKEPGQDTKEGITAFIDSLKLDSSIYELFTIDSIYRIHVNNNGKLRKYAIML